MCAAGSAYAQGTIGFATKVTGQVDALVSYGEPGGVATPADGTYVGQLYAGAAGGALGAIGSSGSVPYGQRPKVTSPPAARCPFPVLRAAPRPR